MRLLGGALLLVDRTMVLFVGLGAGAIIALSFRSGPPPAAPGAGLAGAAAAVPAAERAAAVQPAAAARPGPRLARAITEGRPIEVGVFGDSFGEGVWAGLYNRLRGDERFEVVQLAERSIGFTRYRSLNILEDMRAKLDRQPVDIAVLSFGANDTQGIYHQGHGNAFMSEGWQRIVGERVDAVVGLLRERGAAVYWVGLPRMRDPRFDGDIQQINLFYAERMAQLDVPFIETVPLTVDEQGHYAPYLPLRPGRAERQAARLNDGVHMTIPGYVHVTGGLTEQIRATVDRARAQVEPGPAATASQAAES